MLVIIENKSMGLNMDKEFQSCHQKFRSRLHDAAIPTDRIASSMVKQNPWYLLDLDSEKGYVYLEYEYISNGMRLRFKNIVYL